MSIFQREFLWFSSALWFMFLTNNFWSENLLRRGNMSPSIVLKDLARKLKKPNIFHASIYEANISLIFWIYNLLHLNNATSSGRKKNKLSIFVLLHLLRLINLFGCWMSLFDLWHESMFPFIASRRHWRFINTNVGVIVVRVTSNVVT